MNNAATRKQSQQKKRTYILVDPVAVFQYMTPRSNNNGNPQQRNRQNKRSKKEPAGQTHEMQRHFFAAGFGLGLPFFSSTTSSAFRSSCRTRRMANGNAETKSRNGR